MSAPVEEVQFNLDGILSELGSFGKYQLFLLVLLAFRDSFLHMCNFNYVFTAADVNFRCHVPECELSPPIFNTSWSDYATQKSVCLRSVTEHSNITECTPDIFLENKTMPCDDVIYENNNSIVAEFNLGCQPWKRTLIGTVHNLGLVFSYIISGIISDRYGRKVIIVGTPLMVGIAGLLKSFTFDYWSLLVLEFLETALGYGNASMVLSLETVSQKSRVAFSCISDILSSLGAALFGLIAWKIPYWRYMMRAIYAPLLIVVFYIFLVDEGVRWLLAHNRKEEAVRVLNKVAKINNITLSSKAKEMLSTISNEQNRMVEMNQQSKDEPVEILAVLRSKTILVRLSVIAACFICSMFVFSGAIIYSTNISGNKYMNYSMMILLGVPTRIITAFTLTRFGRKAPICIAYCLCSCFFMASAFVPKSVAWASTILYMIGKMCSSYGIFSVYVVGMEVFPTTSRNSLVNIANTVGRIGSVIAPQTPLLEKYMPGLPVVVFSLAALGPALLALLLPDTSAALPDRLKDLQVQEKDGGVTSASA
ncbi:organic cation transporter protein-like [Danaus plexippus]|uniref:organic cation transporter protein-like n=1 Tax=Danaus plexippus TaxID=13037 RepID=UPI002AAF6CFE|nr:organic cation transporter protein-like [Danaus plexippus]XP_032516752.2 organic cation transporter protein-like [Danaus plexippus]XP_032516753.2 organic cation transporter protein-like [Danaus plexippus]